MGEKPRLLVAGGIYHVTNRGNNRADIFRDDIDYAVFLRLFAKVVASFGWRCHAYCLIPNHYHLLIDTPEPNLARGMRILNGTYAQRFNGRHSRVGHVFQGPYAAGLIETDRHLLETARSIALDPVRAGLCDRPEEWPWSSYAATVGAQEAPSFLETETLLAHFDGAEGFKAFVLADRGERQRPGQDQVAGRGWERAGDGW